MAEEMFNGAMGVGALLTYDDQGVPIAFVRGKVREREADMALLKDWLRALTRHVGEIADEAQS